MKKIRRAVVIVLDGCGAGWQHDAAEYGDEGANTLRHVIDAAWRTGEIEQQHRLFGDTIDARRGKPTCGEMIAQLAEELRWEG